MALITYRQCIVCHELMECKNSKKIAHGKCLVKMHRMRLKLNLTNSEIIRKLKEDLRQQKETENEETKPS
ncbi:hypothetical protein SAMN05216295_101356 [Pseudomonas luteola]|nr:hypothetical protein SAMN05216295_101356 [Pseudomonas zeshuii]